MCAQNRAGDTQRGFKVLYKNIDDRRQEAKENSEHGVHSHTSKKSVFLCDHVCDDVDFTTKTMEENPAIAIATSARLIRVSGELNIALPFC